MFSKKLIIFLYSVLFVVVLLIAAFFAFSINKIDTEYTFLNNDDVKAELINEKLSSFFGKNILFLDAKDITDCINEDPYFDCVLVKKSLPNTVKVVVRERSEVYLFTFGDEQYIADEDGFVLRKFDGEKPRNLISLCLDGFNAEEPVIGTYISTEFDDSLKNAFETTKAVGLFDRIDKMTVCKVYSGTLTEFRIDYLTYTNVVVRINKSDDAGVEKAKTIFDAYDSKTTDYEKSFYSIEALKLDDGTIRILWTRNGEILS